MAQQPSPSSTCMNPNAPILEGALCIVPVVTPGKHGNPSHPPTNLSKRVLTLQSHGLSRNTTALTHDTAIESIMHTRSCKQRPQRRGITRQIHRWRSIRCAECGPEYVRQATGVSEVFGLSGSCTKFPPVFNSSAVFNIHLVDCKTTLSSIYRVSQDSTHPRFADRKIYR